MCPASSLYISSWTTFVIAREATGCKAGVCRVVQGPCGVPVLSDVSCLSGAAIRTARAMLIVTTAAAWWRVVSSPYVWRPSFDPPFPPVTSPAAAAAAATSQSPSQPPTGPQD
ncbi:hypothetical protein Vretimale_18495 [Volvox reticuliferus]|uniref:Uncharacterized protein n=1 Tax=Volvox reticuliferus TaxID=1737510 RepID=A0A8J4LZE8_9CHLO|nr:hypothetical protein Vretifemale_19763 [Volvox reticuliferus]GIM15792.1 hypothetical protein Vretimale_18495 [Volvox reticuliferus]